jgi:hypothetical protein
MNRGDTAVSGTPRVSTPSAVALQTTAALSAPRAHRSTCVVPALRAPHVQCDKTQVSRRGAVCHRGALQRAAQSMPQAGHRPEAPPSEEEAGASSTGSAQEDALAAGALFAVGLGALWLVKRVLFSGSRAAQSTAAPQPGNGVASKRQPRGAVASWSVHGVSEFLHSLDLPQHVAAFLDNAVDGALLLTLSTEDLVELGVVRRVHRVRARPGGRTVSGGDTCQKHLWVELRRLSHTTRLVPCTSQKKMRLRLGLPLEEDDGASSLAVRRSGPPPLWQRTQSAGATQHLCATSPTAAAAPLRAHECG